MLDGDKEPATIESRVARQEKLQYEEGRGIFAVQYTTVHKCAATDNISGLKDFVEEHGVDVDARVRRAPVCMGVILGAP